MGPTPSGERAGRWWGPLIFLSLALACAAPRPASPPAPARLPTLGFAIDTLRAQRVAPGVTLWFIYASSGPWAIHALDVDRDSCNVAVAVKGSPGAVGREKTSTLLQRLGDSTDVVGGVNAGFFLFAPPGVPAGALVTRGRVIAGPPPSPSAQPVLAFDSAGGPHVVTLRARGSLTVGARRFEIGAWNRPVTHGLALLDDSWDRVTDTASTTIEVALSGRHPSRVVLVDTTRPGVAIPPDGAVLVAHGRTAALLGSTLLALAVDDTVRAEVALDPFHPKDAVAGRPVLLRDSVIMDAVDTEGQPRFAMGRHPRTAVGIGRNGRRLLLVVVDGRQGPYSDGMTLRELASLLHALGARDAINLDGGGSTTLVYAEPGVPRVLRVANRPSDATGERPVGDALAIVRHCGLDRDAAQPK